MKQISAFLLVFFSLIQIQFAVAQNKMDSLLIERQNLYQNFILKMDPRIFTDPDFVSNINAMGSIDSMVSEEAHRIDSTFAANEKMSPLIGITLENLRNKRDKAQIYFYISIFFLVLLIGLSIYLAEKIKNLTKSIAFLDADIAEANNNYSRVSEEKIILHRELNIKLKSLNNRVEALIIENENLTNDNKKVKSEINQLNTSKTNTNEHSNQYLTENKFLKEAIIILENQKLNLENEINTLRDSIKNTKPATNNDAENIKNELIKRIEHLENALKTKDIMEGVIAKRNKELEDNFKDVNDHINQLSLELEDEKAYNEKLNSQVAFYEEEVNEKELELKTLWNKLSQQIAIKTNIKSEDPETNMLKTLEKLSRLKQADILSNDEYNILKEKIISQY